MANCRLLQNVRIGYNFIGKLPLKLGIFLALIGKKRYFLALGMIPVNGVGFIGRKITECDDFDFDIVNFPFMDGDVPRRPSYGVYISQLIRFVFM